MSSDTDELRGHELRPRQWGPPFIALVIAEVLLLDGGHRDLLRAIVALGAVGAVTYGLLEVVREQYKLSSAADGRTPQAQAFADRAFQSKQVARLWGLLTIVAAIGAVVPESGRHATDYEKLVALSILFVIAMVISIVGRDVETFDPPSWLPGRVLIGFGTILGLIAVALAAVILVSL